MVLLLRAYGGLPAGAITEFPASTEAALVAQGIASVSSSAATTGAFTSTMMRGTASIAAGASSVVITNASVDVTSFCMAVVNQTAADGTLLRVERVVPAAGSFTIFGTANATATTEISWCVINSMPLSSN
jgi:hypothetical protein